jgi:signal transduction histidine kinase/CheY-like chemotaxis protein
VGPFDLLARLTARLASTARLDEFADAVLQEIVGLGFGVVWMAVLDEQTGALSVLRSVADGVDTTLRMPKIVALDTRQPLGHGFRERRIINITDPDSLHILERDDEAVPPDKMALHRASFDRLRGHPFACGPLLGSGAQPVGALALSSYHGNQPIPDAVFSHGPLRVVMDHLGIAMDRALHAVRAERLNASLLEAQEAMSRDARIKAVGELAAAIAHDLNNLSGIALLAIDAGSRAPADAFDALPRIARANRAIGDLVARLQRISRAPSSQAETAKLPQIVDDILVMVAPILREQSIEVDFDLPAAPPVLCDAVLVHQVVLNLLLNAHDALCQIPSDRRRIAIRLRAEAGSVRLVVTDTGPGIAPQVLARLFEPYVTTKGSAHLGLGLAAARASLQQFGGRLEAHNAPTGGAVFEVTLVAAPSGAPDGSVTPHLPTATKATTGARILAVDDDADVVYVVRVSLEQHGYEVSTATSSARAIEAATARAFDLVLCDIGMPKQSGIDVCRILRKGGYRGKFVLMTGWDSQVLSAEQRAAGCDALMKKPFGAMELIDVIHAQLVS